MKKYELIYADPPWRYRSGKVQGAAINHYATMSDEELYQLPVAEIAADNCVLLLWATFPKLPEALRLIEAWGFQYKTVGFVWVKTNPSGNGFFLGLGWWTRSNAEICLLAVARETSPGWDVWGNEVDCSITLTQSEGDVHE